MCADDNNNLPAGGCHTVIQRTPKGKLAWLDMNDLGTAMGCDLGCFIRGAGINHDNFNILDGLFFNTSEQAPDMLSLVVGSDYN